MYLKSFCKNSKMGLYINTNDDFTEYNKGLDKYYSFVDLKIYDIENEDTEEPDEQELKLVARIETIIFDYDLIEEDDEDIVDVADSITGDVYSNIEELINSKYFDNNYIFVGNICSLERFYIMPEYRNKGIGKYLINNLCELIKEHSNINISYIVAFLKPMDFIDNKWVDTPNPQKMKNMMVEFYKNNGFKRIKKSNYFVFKNG
ncbi:MAG: GNAT family N-acetyltransferase [Clostridium sp.]|uniref:Acetyltransferase domain containing protein n=1 Tax=Siphoviridae sp. ctwQT14 TaxID=2827971 RepID=A0A8S5TL63_9CAUD|nr:GNAT family N-acetyltransferase [Clostridium sp.]DAF63522.1 MAG TPA: acetyltransferase domain containing protein [Siphoviridae sp. ctwQT14]